MSGLDREKTLTSVTISELKKAVEGLSDDIPSDRALDTLLHKRMAGKPQLLRSTIATSQDESLRIVALRGLGMNSNDVARNALTELLTNRSIPELRVTIGSLAKIGKESELESLKSFRSTAPSVLKPRINAAIRLIAFRNGIDTERVKKPASADIRRPRAGTGVDMKIGAVSAQELKRFSRRLGEEVPGVNLSLNRAVEAVCLKQTVWLMHNRSIESVNGIKALQRSPQVAMAIMGYAHCSDRPYLYAHVLSQPTDQGIELFVSRLNGEITHFGEGKFDSSKVNFDLASVVTRFAPAISISGQFDGGNGVLTLATAVTQKDTTEQEKLSRRPKLVESI